MTWNELKEFCNSLPEHELGKNVFMWREEECIDKIEAEQLEEDYYVHLERPEDGCVSESDANSLIRDNGDEYPNGMNDFVKVYDKGHPILWAGF